MKKVLIIGGGVSGLSCGIYALLNGYSATICEKHATAGGNLTGWQRGDYQIDNCIHWLTGTHKSTAMHKMWEELGALGNIDIIKNDSMYTCEKDGKTLSLCRNLNKLHWNMLSVSPEDEKEINDFIRAIRITQTLSDLPGCDKRGAMAKALSVPLLYKYYRLSAGELSRRFKHPLLKSFIVSLVSENFMSLALILVAANFCAENADLPAGGSLAMAQRMANRFTSLGGELICGKKAEKINVEFGKARSVCFQDGGEIAADFIVATPEPKFTFNELLGMKLPRGLEKQYENRKLIRFSSVQTAFSCDTDKLPFTADIIFDLPQNHAEKLKTDRLILREFSHEKEYAPFGKTVLQTMTFCDERECRRYIELSKDEKGYSTEKKEYAQTVKAAIEEQFPMLTGKINCLDVWTPATYRKFTGAEIGSYMSFVFPGRIYPFAQSNIVKGVRNLILASQWLRAPGGLPIAANSGREAAQTIMRIDKRQKVRTFEPNEVLALEE